MELIKSKTFENLKKAFIAECCARTRYEFVEYGQRYNGNEGIATIIDKIAYQEFNHARMLYTKIQSATKGTIDNEESKELNSLLMEVKGESENTGLKFNIQKTKIMASGPIT